MIYFSLKYVEVLPVSKPSEHQIFHLTGKATLFHRSSLVKNNYQPAYILGGKKACLLILKSPPE